MRWRALEKNGRNGESRWGTREHDSMRPELARQSGLDMNLLFPSPRQQFVEAVNRMSVDHAREHVAQVSIGFDAVELAGFNQRAGDCPAFASTVAACEEMVLPAERHRADRTLDRIGVQFNAAIVQEVRQTFPTRERVTDRLGKCAAAA